jgi:hypothetical protein
MQTHIISAIGRSKEVANTTQFKGAMPAEGYAYTFFKGLPRDKFSIFWGEENSTEDCKVM